MTGSPKGSSPASLSSRPMIGWVMMNDAPASTLRLIFASSESCGS